MTVAAVRKDDDTAAFLDGTATGEFRIKRCPEGHSAEPSAGVCGRCGASELVWCAATGGARLISWTVTHARADGSNTVLAIVELDEGPWWWTQLADADPDTLVANLRVRVDFQRADAEHEAVPVFRVG